MKKLNLNYSRMLLVTFTSLAILVSVLSVAPAFGQTQSPATAPSITISMDKSSYTLGDTIVISGQVQATDQQGNPVSSFSKGSNGFVKVVLSAQSSTSSLVTVNLFDSDLTTLGIGSFKTTLNTGQSEVILSFPIPNDVVLGTGNIYTDVFTDWPSNGGKPLTGESSSMVGIK